MAVSLFLNQSNFEMSKVDNRIGRKKTKRETSRDKTIRTKSEQCVILVDSKQTEYNYFEELRKSDLCSPRISIKVRKAKKTETIVKEAKRRVFQPSRLVWLVFDRDEIGTFDEIIEEAKKEGFQVGWSNPCFEIWLHAYLGDMPKSDSSQQCISRFATDYKKLTKKEYKKNDPNLFSTLEKYGSFEKAYELAGKKLKEAERDYPNPSNQNPACTVHYLVARLRKRNEG